MERPTKEEYYLDIAKNIGSRYGQDQNSENFF